MDPYIVPPAETTYKDWVGTAAAETSVVNTSLDLHKLAGLDSERFTIVGIDLSAYSHGEPSDWDVRVYAVDTKAHGIQTGGDWSKIADEDGSLPVTEVALHNVTLEDVVRSMKLVHFQLLNPALGPLKVVEQTDFPPENPY